MPSKSIVVCLVCDTTLILPDDPIALAESVTDFVDTHNLMQHWKFDLIPPSGTEESEETARHMTSQGQPPAP